MVKGQDVSEASLRALDVSSTQGDRGFSRDLVSKIREVPLA